MIDSSDFEDLKGWFRYCEREGRHAREDGEPRIAPFKDADACGAWEGGYDDVPVPDAGAGH